MSNSRLPISSFVYGLPNSAAKAYFICQKYISTGKNTLFITHADPVDFEEAARTFAPATTQLLTFADTDTGRMAACTNCLLRKKGLY